MSDEAFQWARIIITGLGVFIAAIAAGIAIATIIQKRTADNRNAWWQRLQWAIDRATDADPDKRLAQMVSLDVLDVIAESSLKTKEDIDLARAIQDFFNAMEDSGETAVDSEQQEGGEQA
jgi:hypothetical protein